MAFAIYLLGLASLAELHPDPVGPLHQEGRAIFVVATQGCFGGSRAQIAVEWQDEGATLTAVFTERGRAEKGSVEFSMEEAEMLLAAFDAVYQSDDDQGRCLTTTTASVRGSCERGSCSDRPWRVDVESQSCAVVDEVHAIVGTVRERLEGHLQTEVGLASEGLKDPPMAEVK